MSEPSIAVPSTDPVEVFDRFRDNVLAGSAGLTADLCAEDVVVEMPFAATGVPRRIVGRDRVVAFAAAGRAALPVRFDTFRTTALHRTADPEVIVVEYEVTGTTAGRPATAAFVLALTVRNGRVVHWREYQDTAAIGRALADAH